MDQSNDKLLNRSWQEWVRIGGNYLVVIITHSWVRVTIMLLLMLSLAWLSFTRGYIPLTEDVELPVSVLENNPSLDIRTLQTINTDRAERVRRERLDYSSYARVLVAPEKNN